MSGWRRVVFPEYLQHHYMVRPDPLHLASCAVLRALRDTILSLAELRDDPPAAFAAAVANPACCDRAQVLQREQCPLVITCSIIGWTMNMTPDPCAWEGVGCSEGGRVTQL